MSVRAIFGLVLVVLLASVPVGSACSSSNYTTSTATATLHAIGATYYLVVMGCNPGYICPFAEYVYQELNDVPGLQRSDLAHVDYPGCTPWEAAYFSDLEQW